MAKKTVVMGASENPARYSNMAIKKLVAHNHPVVAIGRRDGKVNGVPITKDPAPEKDVGNACHRLVARLGAGFPARDSWSANDSRRC